MRIIGIFCAVVSGLVASRRLSRLDRSHCARGNIVIYPRYQASLLTALDGRVNALDYFGTWKLFDALEESAFYGRNREYALGNTPQQRYMGKWSDGTIGRARTTRLVKRERRTLDSCERDGCRSWQREVAARVITAAGEYD
jgi:hypothetical protein